MTDKRSKAHFQKTYEGWIRSIDAKLVVLPVSNNLFSDSIYTHPNGMNIRIVQSNDNSDRIILVTKLGFPPDAQKLISSLPEGKLEALHNEIILLLTKMGVQFSINIQDKNWQEIVLERTVFGEGMRKQVFFDNLYRVIDALVALDAKLHQKLGAITPDIGSGRSTANAPYH